MEEDQKTFTAEETEDYTETDFPLDSDYGEENPSGPAQEGIRLFDDPDIVEIRMQKYLKRKRRAKASALKGGGIGLFKTFPRWLRYALIGCAVLAVLLAIFIPLLGKSKGVTKADVSAEDAQALPEETLTEGQTEQASTDENGAIATEETVTVETATDIPATETETLMATEFAADGADADATATHPLDGIGKMGKHGWFLSLNDDYPIVAELQERLNELGYMEIPETNGVKGFTTFFGPATKAAVRAFQAVNDLDIDGMVGKTTYDLLMSDGAKALVFNNSCIDSVFETYIVKLQKRLIELRYLDGTVSGKFADKTKQALKAFQKKNGLSADGVAGPMTLALLYSDNAIDARGNAVPYIPETAATESTSTPNPSATPDAEAKETAEVS